MRGILKTGLTILICIGVIRGVVRYNEAHGSGGIERLVTSFIGAVEDITYRWLPAAIDMLQGLIPGAGA